MAEKKMSAAARRRKERKRYDAKPDGPRKESKRVNAQFKLGGTLTSMGKHGHTRAGGAPKEKNAATKHMVRGNPKGYAISKSIASTRKATKKAAKKGSK